MIDHYIMKILRDSSGAPFGVGYTGHNVSAKSMQNQESMIKAMRRAGIIKGIHNKSICIYQSSEGWNVEIKGKLTYLLTDS